MEIANTSITIMRGQSVNDAGDVTNVGLPLYRGVPAALIEKSHTTYDPAASTRRTIRVVMCMLPSWADVVITDTIMDAQVTPAAYYMIEDIQRQPTLGSPPDLILTLRARSGVAVSTD